MDLMPESSNQPLPIKPPIPFLSFRENQTLYTIESTFIKHYLH